MLPFLRIFLCKIQKSTSLGRNKLQSPDVHRAKPDWDFRISDPVKKPLIELIFNLCGEFRWSPEGPVSQIHSPSLHVVTPGIFSDFLRSVQMLKGEWGAESNGKLPHLLIPSKIAIMVPEFAVKDLALVRTLWWLWWCLWWRCAYACVCICRFHVSIFILMIRLLFWFNWIRF